VRTVFIGQKVYQRSKDKLERAESKAHGRSKPMSEKKEYIERGALIKKLNNLVTTSDLFGMGVQSGFSHAISEANAIPAADVEPVVRCKDCVAYAGKERKGGGIMMICRINKHEASPEHFCSQGRNRAHMERSGSGETY
jgi:hypothetical protein